MNENETEIEEGRSNIVALKKKFAKVVCRDPPDDVTMETVLQDLFNKNNVHLHQVPMMHREMRIIDTRFDWIFEMSSVEAAVIQTQGGRILVVAFFITACKYIFIAGMPIAFVTPIITIVPCDCNWIT